MTYYFEIFGDIPSKKNNLKPRKGGMYYGTGTRDKLDMMVAQLNLQRVKHKIMKPITEEVCVGILLRGKQKNDIDNQATSILDALQKSRIIANDKQVYTLVIQRHETRENKTGIYIFEKEK